MPGAYTMVLSVFYNLNATKLSNFSFANDNNLIFVHYNPKRKRYERVGTDYKSKDI